MKSKGSDKGCRVRFALVVLGLCLGSRAGLALDRWEELTQAGLKFQRQGRMTEAEQNLREAVRKLKNPAARMLLVAGQEFPQSRSSPLRPRQVS